MTVPGSLADEEALCWRDRHVVQEHVHHFHLQPAEGDRNAYYYYYYDYYYDDYYDYYYDYARRWSQLKRQKSINSSWYMCDMDAG